MKDFEEMEVWRDAQDLAIDVYRDFANVRDLSFCDQIKRAAVPVSNNIAEGADRGSAVDFARFLEIAKGSVGEVRSMYRLARKFGFVSDDLCQQRCTTCLSITKQLAGFAKYLRNK